jgi:hypothetical protein
VRLFLDTSVLIAACGSGTGASREIFNRASNNNWILVATPYVLEELLRNLPDFSLSAVADWTRLRPALSIMNDLLTLDRPVVFESTKDRPILFSVLAWADVLLTLDLSDFGGLMDKSFYGLSVMKLGTFLVREREAGRLL